MTTLSSILAWEIPWIEEPGGPQSMNRKRFKQDLATKQQQLLYLCISLFIYLPVTHSPLNIVGSYYLQCTVTAGTDNKSMYLPLRDSIV